MLRYDLIRTCPHSAYLIFDAEYTLRVNDRDYRYVVRTQNVERVSESEVITKSVLINFTTIEKADGKINHFLSRTRGFDNF